MQKARYDARTGLSALVKTILPNYKEWSCSVIDFGWYPCLLRDKETGLGNNAVK